MDRKLILSCLLSSLSAVFFLATGPVWAQTGDGIVPAIEEVCDDDPFSFGLCNAYCEALDCDSETPIGSETACERVLDNYHKKSGDLDPPCEEPAVCPCAFDLNGDLADLEATYGVDFPGFPLDAGTLESFCLTVHSENSFITQEFDIDDVSGIRLLYWVDPGSCNELGGPVDGSGVADDDDYRDSVYEHFGPYLENTDMSANAGEEAACRADLTALCDSLMN